jgi:hypothetical protein
MPTPQWKEPTVGLEGTWGFDRTSTPPWLMVGVGQGKAMLLEFASGKLVKSVNDRIAAVTEQGSDPSGRFFEIKGGTYPASTRIEVRNPTTRNLETTLAVSVKGKKRQRVSFHFVEDKAGDKTTRQLDIVDGLIDELNSIYENQTNITFETGVFGDVKVDMDLDDVVLKGFDPKTKSRTGEPITLQRPWREIVRKGDKGSDFNVFFVPSQSPEALLLTQGSDCVIEDGVPLLDVHLPHEIGLSLGCPPTVDFNQGHHLMFSATSNPNVNPRNGNFIPKACANIMNP